MIIVVIGIIAGFMPSDDDVWRHRLIINALLPGSTTVQRWQAAQQIAMLYCVPLAMMAIGKTVDGADGAKRVIVQRSILAAPLRRVARAFREAAPLH